jgi:glucans biosynthesis protein C
MRKHYFDNGKGIASLLGFFYHTGLIFSIPWIVNVKPSEFSEKMGLFTEFLTLFRMPMFMFISGYFALHAVKKYNIVDFSKRRFLRLVLPLTSTLFTFVFLMYIYSDILYYQSTDLKGIINYVTPWSSEFKLSHLWFLYFVIIYSFLLYLIYTINNKFNSILSKKISNYIGSSNVSPWILDSIIITFSISVLVLGKIFSLVIPIDHALLPFRDLSVYLPYFLLGAITYFSWDKLSEYLLTPKKSRILITFLTALILFCLTQTQDHIFTTVFNVISKYYILTLVLYFLYRFFNRTNKLLRYLSDSSYVIYLLHQPIIIIVAYYILTYTSFSIIISYIFITLASILFTFIIDRFIIQRFLLLKFLYTGTK